MNELDIIKIITKSSNRLPPTYSPIGDDVSIVPKRDGKLVIKCDMLVGKTDVPSQMSYRDAARKAAAMCVSDFGAKGVKPDSFLISLGLPKGTSDRNVRNLAYGFKEASEEWKVNLVGGDTNEASDLIIDCIMFGFSDKIVTRDGAKPGQLIITSGYFGYPSSGLRILNGAKAETKFKKVALWSVFRPTPRLELGLAISSHLSSSIDSSDGLAICLHTLARMSRVGMIIKKLPYRKELERFAIMNEYSLEDLVLYGGEEYEIVGTISKERFKEANKLAKMMDEELLVIGETTEESKKVVIESEEGTKDIEERGWIHLT
jgi:thiamine-monophosphate kinase